MARRVECGEIVENATGLNVTGALVTIKIHGGANAPVYDAENGGALVSQPLSTVNGKIGADYPLGAWVAEGDYDIIVAGGAPGGGDLTFFWPARRDTQLVTTLPAGVGTSAPEDGERAIELYDAANGGAWLRRYRGAASAWDMVGGPPPAGGSLPGTPRARQEFYVTGGTPPVQHFRYNGSSWDYIGTPPTVPITGSPVDVKLPGLSSQRRAGRTLTLADFTTLLGLSAPIGLYNLSDASDISGNSRTLQNRGSVPFSAIGIEGSGNTAAQFVGNTAQALYIDDAAGGNFNPRTVTCGAWIKFPRRAVSQAAVGKYQTTGNQRSYLLEVTTGFLPTAFISIDGTAAVQLTGFTEVADDQWHHLAMTFDGTLLKLYVDGAVEAVTGAGTTGTLFQSTAPFNVGGWGGTATGPVATSDPALGRVDEAFVTSEVLSDEQVRLLYAAKFAHGYTSTPTRAHMSVRRKRHAVPVTGDFPSTPSRLYIAGVDNNQGSDANGAAGTTATLRRNTTPQTGFAGIAGEASGAWGLTGGANLSAVDTGLPAGTASRTFGIWFKRAGTIAATETLMNWGTAPGTADARFGLASTGQVYANSAADALTTGELYIDGQWHFLCEVDDNAEASGVKRKVYIDGRMRLASTTLNSITLAGADKFRIGSNNDATSPFTGTVGPAFVFSGALTWEQIMALWIKSSQALPTSPKAESDHIEAMDAASIYAIADSLEAWFSYDLAVAA